MRASFEGPPPLFNQGVSARARVAFFSFLAIALIIIDSRVRMLETVRIGLGVVLHPVQQVLLVPSRVAETVSDYFTSVATLTRENEELKRKQFETAQSMQQARELLVENERLRKLLGARERIGNATVLADVLYESRDRFSRKLVLNAGTNEGVRAGSPVIDDAGVVGQITRVFNDTCEVTLLTDKDQSIPVQILRNGLRGVAFGGAEPGTLDLRFMAPNADVVNGDAVTTSGIDGVYPSGLMVATVSRVERVAKDQFARIVMEPVAGIESNKHLLVLLVQPAKQVAPPATVVAPPRKGVRK
ncbi:MAG TPA: rod shape-determining protein MreC [Burkholderiaceae bacterium]|nr:rod shape-determining protein MreC [Burkholderiaceae bacterium]